MKPDLTACAGGHAAPSTASEGPVTAQRAAATSTLPQSWIPALVRPLARRLKVGQLQLRLPDGQSLLLGATAATPRGPLQASLHVHRWRLFWRLLSRGDLGLAEAYRDGDWSTPDLNALLRLGAANEQTSRSTWRARGPVRWLLRQWHAARANTRRGSRRNIAFHYDLGNDFYAQWLDPTWQYSSAIYPDGPAGETMELEAAQRRKLARIVEALDLGALGPQGRVLEIGCGWGTLARELARAFPGQVTGLTLSREQLAHAQAAVVSEGLQDRVDLRLQDYRDVDGAFDRIVSIEMLEAVGEAWWPVYFETLKRRLKPGGRAVIQVITIDDAWFEDYRRGTDFIQRHIFPGGMLPSPSALRRLAADAGLRWLDGETFGPSYARTLSAWQQRFQAAWPRIEALGGYDARFRRLWSYYLSYCEVGFLEGRVDVALITLERPLEEAPAR